MTLRYLDEFREPSLAHRCAREIERTVTRPWTIMEVCGGQTHAIVKYGIESLLPSLVTLIHGPGCPVCVTPQPMIDRAIELARIPGVILCCFGDMMRVPGSAGDLQSAHAGGGDIRVVYSPLDAVEIARRNPTSEIVFFAVGFETTAPANALAVWRAHDEHIDNFFILNAHVLIPPAMAAILSSSDCQVKGFLAAGHVCTVTGNDQYQALAAKHRTPIVVTGFEPVDILQGILLCVQQLESGRFEVVNQYTRSVRSHGNEDAQRLVDEVFEVRDAEWRGLGVIASSGLRLRDAYRSHDAETRFGMTSLRAEAHQECPSGLVLQGRLEPAACPDFGTRCTPEHPLGATMVSDEGACAAYYRYRPASGSVLPHRING